MDQCKCKHHMVSKVVMVLALVSAVGFWVSAWRHTPLMGIGHQHFFEEFIVFSLLGIGMQRGCSCCCGGCENCSVNKM